MTLQWREQLRPGTALRNIVQQATDALVSMDADRLEELACCCVDLNRDLQDSDKRAEVGVALLQVTDQIELLDRVLKESRANLGVFTRLHSIRLRKAGYDARYKGLCECTGREAQYGND